MERDSVINVHGCSCKVPVFLVRFLMKIEFSRQILGNAQISNFMKIRLVGSELFHVDGQTQTDRQTDKHEETNSCCIQFCVRTLNCITLLNHFVSAFTTISCV
jgi:hypothetical protein